ncbi:hypothetical protein CFP56_039007 [Quercus suber]|uniref:Uncharacterized protein n=1 Tax=Quercus suber TaxID=58331 RepID=A0AAW0J0N2_QUESU
MIQICTRIFCKEKPNRDHNNRHEAESCICDHGIQRPTMNEQAVATKYTNSEVVSFRVATANGAPWFNNFYHGQVLESNSGTELSTINIGLSYPSLDSVTISITSEDVSSGTKNSSS